MVLVSGAGTTLENLCNKIHFKQLNATINCVAANHVNIPAIDVVNKWDLPLWVLDPKVYPPREKWDATFADVVAAYRPAVIVLAGFDSLLRIPPGYVERVVNVHPSLLPRYGGKGMYGDRVHAAVLANCEAETGVTVHLCDDEYDHGKILAQEKVPVKPEDTVETLRQRVQTLERSLFPKVLGDHLDYLESKNLY